MSATVLRAFFRNGLYRSRRSGVHLGLRPYSASQGHVSGISPPLVAPAAANSTDTIAEALAGSPVSHAPWEYVMESSILWPSNLLERGLELLHWTTGLSWGASIILYTIAMRSALFPLHLKQTRSTLTANNLKPEVNKLQTECQALREQGKVDESHKKLQQLTRFMSEKGINPIKILGLSVAPLPFFMATFFAIRNMASQPIASFVNEGFFWFQNLGVADPYYILPAISTLTLLLTVELPRYSTPNQNMSPGMRVGLCVFAAASFPVLSFMPAGLVLYFCTSNIITCLIQSLWISKAAKRFFAIPDMVPGSVPAKKASLLEDLKTAYRSHLRDVERTTSSAAVSSGPPKVLAQRPKL